MRFRTYNQPQDYPPVNHFYDPYSQQNVNSNQDWNSTENYQTPYDFFSKPELQTQWPNIQPQNSAQGEPGFANQSNPLNPPNNQAGGPASYFQNANGQLDFDKVISTVGQLASTYHQVSPIVQQFSSFIKNFR